MWGEYLIATGRCKDQSYLMKKSIFCQNHNQESRAARLIVVGASAEEGAASDDSTPSSMVSRECGSGAFELRDFSGPTR